VNRSVFIFPLFYVEPAWSCDQETFIWGIVKKVFI